MKKIIVLLLVLFLPFYVKAANDKLNVYDIKVIETSKDFKIDNPKFEGNEVLSNIDFKNPNEYVVYEITVKNNSSEKYELESIKDNNSNKNITINYDYPDKELEVNKTLTFKMTIKYATQIEENNVKLDDIKVTLVFDEEEEMEIVVPITGDNIYHYIILFVISLIVLLSCIYYKKVSKSTLLLLIALLPILVYAKEQMQLDLVFKNITITNTKEVEPEEPEVEVIYNIEIDPANGDEKDNREIKPGDKIGDLTQPTKEGYDFVGWFDENDEEVDENTVVTGDLVIIAKYEKHVYSVTINPNNGEDVETRDIPYEDSIGSLQPPTKDNYDFIGWFIGNEEVTENTVVTSDLVIEAKYEATKYPIVYHMDGGTTESPTEYTILDEVTLLDATRGGYAFKGWYLDEELTSDVVTSIPLGSSGEKNFYAKWEMEEYTITFVLNGGQQTEPLTRTYTVTTDTFALPLPTKDNNTFKGWCEKEDLSDTPVGYVEKGTYGDKTLYAKWKELQDQAGSTFFDVIKEDAVPDNEKSIFVSSDEGIDFSDSSNGSNGSGTYIIGDTVDDDNPIYYYRGDVYSNHVIFNGHCWLIVRTTETGGIKIVYNGLETNGTCVKTGVDKFIGNKVKYNSSNGREEAMSYTYNNPHALTGIQKTSLAVGTVFGNDVQYENGSYKLIDTYALPDGWQDNVEEIFKTHHYSCNTTGDTCTEVRFYYMGRDPQFFYTLLKNGDKIDDVTDNTAFNVETDTNSTIKNYIDNWYAANMTEKTSFLEDTVWCNDRSLYTKGGWDKDQTIFDNKATFGPTARISITFKPSTKCQNVKDRYTVSPANGNGGLTYPIALLTADEAVFAGYGWFQQSAHSYLYTTDLWWTMSPSLLSANFSYIDVVYSMLDNVQSAYTSSNSALTSGCVRPAISLKHDTIILRGTGTWDNPYIVKED